MRKAFFVTILLAGGLAAGLPPRQSAGCTVPVFGYALERWPAEPVDVLLFHRDALGEDARAFHDQVERAAYTEPNTANVRIRLVNVDEAMDDTATAVWQRHASNSLPWVVSLYPGEEREFWAGAVPDPEGAQQLLDSPARRAIARHILQGASGVWVLLRSGQAAKDADALQTLTKALDDASQSLRLPDIDPADAAEVLSPGAADLRISFPVVELDRHNPAEMFFVRMLEKAFRPVPADEPAAFVFFGRGRVAEEMHGAQLSKDWIMPACAFLTGMCSCQIKELNPGVDLLFSAGWSHYIVGRYALEESLPDLIGIASQVSEPAAGDAPPSEPPLPPPAAEPSPLRALAGAGLLVLALLALTAWGLGVRKGRR